MAKNHLKRIMAPKTWPIERKATVFVTRPQPGPHPMENSLPLTILFKDLLGVANSSRGVRFILNTQEALVNGRRMRRPDASAGLFDVISFPSQKTSFRLLMNSLGKLHAVPIAGADAAIVPSRIISKTALPGKKLQLGFHNGRTLLTAKNDHKVGSTVLMTLDGKEESYLPLEHGAFVMVTSGKHVGKSGVVSKIEKEKVFIGAGDDAFETRTSHVFVLGKQKSAIKIE